VRIEVLLVVATPSAADVLRFGGAAGTTPCGTWQFAVSPGRLAQVS